MMMKWFFKQKCFSFFLSVRYDSEFAFRWNGDWYVTIITISLKVEELSWRKDYTSSKKNKIRKEKC